MSHNMPTNSTIMRRFMPLKGAAGMKRVVNDKTLFLQVPKEHMKFPCNALAVRYLHAAQDGGFGRIVILKGPAHKHEYKVEDVVRKVRRWSGPALISHKFQPNTWLDERRKIWVMGPKPNPSAEVISARV